ncbi:hypothetical protein [Streptomyces sp. NPDC002402]
MELQELATLVAVAVGALVLIVRKIPAVCKEAEKAVRAIHSLRDVIRRQEPPQISRPQRARERTSRADGLDGSVSVSRAEQAT